MTGEAATLPGRKVVVIAPNWLGDAVMSLPALALLSRAGATVAVASPGYVARVFWGLESVHELWVDGAGGRLSRVLSRARALRAFGADAVALCPPSFESALPAFVAGIRRRVGFDSDARRLLLTGSLGRPVRTRHLSESYAEVARRTLAALGLRPGGEAPAPALRVTSGEREGAARMLATRGVTGGYVVVVPGAAFGPAKAWPRERYRALCRQLATSVPVVVCGGPGDAAACAEVASGISGVVDVSGATSLGEFFAVVQGARLVVANDSGAPHVGAALGAPVVVLFGSTSPAWTAPVGPNVSILQHKVHCNPCFRRTCPTQLECFAGIEVDTVVREAERWLRTPADSSRRVVARSDRIA